MMALLHLAIYAVMSSRCLKLLLTLGSLCFLLLCISDRIPLALAFLFFMGLMTAIKIMRDMRDWGYTGEWSNGEPAQS